MKQIFLFILFVYVILCSTSYVPSESSCIELCDDCEEYTHFFFGNLENTCEAQEFFKFCMNPYSPICSMFNNTCEKRQKECSLKCEHCLDEPLQGECNEVCTECFLSYNQSEFENICDFFGSIVECLKNQNKLNCYDENSFCGFLKIQCEINNAFLMFDEPCSKCSANISIECEEICNRRCEMFDPFDEFTNSQNETVVCERFKEYHECTSLHEAGKKQCYKQANNWCYWMAAECYDQTNWDCFMCEDMVDFDYDVNDCEGQCFTCFKKNIDETKEKITCETADKFYNCIKNETCFNVDYNCALIPSFCYNGRIDKNCDVCRKLLEFLESNSNILSPVTSFLILIIFLSYTMVLIKNEI